MFCREDTSRAMSISKEEYEKRWESITVSYCQSCADVYGLPVKAKAYSKPTGTCDVCGAETEIAERLMKDNPALANVPLWEGSLS